MKWLSRKAELFSLIFGLLGSISSGIILWSGITDTSGRWNEFARPIGIGIVVLILIVVVLIFLTPTVNRWRDDYIAWQINNKKVR
jgi:membrane protein YdbS with pleckstrin-like domain